MSTTGCVECEENVFEIVLEPERIEIIAECKQGPPGPPGSGVFTQVDTDGITPAATEIIGSITLSTHCAVKWYVMVVDATNSLKKSFEVWAQRSPTNGPEHTQYGTIGDAISFTVDVVEGGGELRLQLTNNGAVNLDTRVLQGPITN